jgi:hypothetical protein
VVIVFSYREVFLGRVLLTRDLAWLFIPDATFFQRSLAAGHFPLWNPLMRGGQPFLASMQSQALFPPRLLALALFAAPRALSAMHIGLVLLSGIHMSKLCRELGCRRSGAAAAALSWSGGALLVGLAAQINVASAVAMTPGALLAAVRLAHRPDRQRLAVLALSSALLALAGSPEFLLVAVLLVVAGGLGRARRINLRTLFWLGGGGVLGVGLSAALLLPGMEAVANSTRAHGLARVSSDWALRLPDLLELALPFHRALQTEGTDYWSTQHFLTSIYFGAAGMTLAGLGLPALWRRWQLGVGVLVLVLLFSLGVLPSSALVRYPAKFFPACTLLLSVSVGMGFDRLLAFVVCLRRQRKTRRMGWLIAASSLGLMALGLKTAGVHGMSLIWAGVVVGLIGGVIWQARFKPGRVRVGLLTLMLGELVFYHLLCPLNVYADIRSFSASPLQQLARDRGRVSVQYDDDDAPQYEAGLFKNSEGERRFDPAGRRYIEQSRHDWVLGRSMEDGVQTIEGYGQPEPYRMALLQTSPVPESVEALLGVGWFVRRAASPYPGLAPLATSEDSVVAFVARSAMPRAWLVPDGKGIEVVGDDEALARVRSEHFQPATQVLLHDALPTPLAGAPVDSTRIDVSDPSPDQVELEIKSPVAGVLVLDDAAYPGWQVEVDGRHSVWSVADFALRGVRVGSGRHHVRWFYRPMSFVIGSSVSLLSAALALLCLLPVSVRA